MAKKSGGRRGNNRKSTENNNNNNNNEGDDHEIDESEKGDYEQEKILLDKAKAYEGRIQFRNYVPRDPVLRKLRLKKLSVPAIVAEISKQLKEVELASQTNVITLAPKKPNWDLKRDAQRKLDKLERRTQRAIYELIKDKLESDGQVVDNLAAAVEAGSRHMGFDNVD